MDGINRYELTEIDKILGMGMLSDSCGAAELVNVLFIRYKVIVEIIWYPNIRRWCPNIRTTAYVPNEMLKLIHDEVQYERITNLLDNCDVSKRHTSIEKHIDTVVNENYVTGSIKY